MNERTKRIFKEFFKLKKEEICKVGSEIIKDCFLVFFILAAGTGALTLILTILGVIISLIYPPWFFVLYDSSTDDSVFGPFICLGSCFAVICITIFGIGYIPYKFFNWIRDNWRQAKCIIEQEDWDKEVSIRANAAFKRQIKRYKK